MSPPGNPPSLLLIITAYILCETAEHIFIFLHAITDVWGASLTKNSYLLFFHSAVQLMNMVISAN